MFTFWLYSLLPRVAITLFFRQLIQLFYGSPLLDQTPAINVQYSHRCGYLRVAPAVCRGAFRVYVVVVQCFAPLWQ
jgi:hypothetical protein